MSTKKIRSIGLLCSGGDSPGMNSAIRAIVRTALSQNLDVWGIRRGYAGLLEGNITAMDASSVGNILQRGGTVLQTSRCLEFHEPKVRAQAYKILQEKKIDALVVIGGDGSFKGAQAMNLEHNLPVVGIPGTIDNDISGTEYTIGFDTAVQTAIDAVDKIRDTAASHQRIFIVEVMGRRSDAIALHVGVCTGAETIVFPHRNIDIKEIYESLKKGMDRGKNSSIVIVAEDDKPGASYAISENLQKMFKINSHVAILGHIQRGGSPSALDRFLASQMGYEAVHAIIRGETPAVTVFRQGKVTMAPLSECLTKRDPYDIKYLELVKTLAI